MKWRKLTNLSLSLMLVLLAFASCWAINLKSGSLPSVASADTGSATGRTVMLIIGSPIMFVNGAGQEIDPGYNTAPVIVNGRTYLPIRALIGDAGTVNWDASQKKATVVLGSNTIVLTIGSKNALVNGSAKTMDAAPFLSSTGRTMLPLRFIVENLSMKVDWYAAAHTAVVSMASASAASTLAAVQPAAGVSWQAGSSCTISWAYSSLAGAVSIDLLEGNTTSSITGSTSVGSGGYGSYIWTPGPDLNAGSTYRIRVTSTSNASVSSTSNYFAISGASGSISGASASIGVTAPTSSSDWDAGSTHTISWSYSGLSSSDTVRIDLLKDGNYTNIDTSVDIGNGGIGSYSWTIDSDLDDADDYQIRVRSESNTSIYDLSSDFSIGASSASSGASASIGITAPTSSSDWDAGSTHTISWSYSSIDSDTTVSIELLKDGDHLDTLTSDRDIGNGGYGSYSWTPNSGLDADDDYQIRITSDDDKDVTDTSSNFTITSGGPSIMISQPASGTTWKTGSSYDIDWKYAGLDSNSTIRIDLYKGSSFEDTIVDDRDIGSGGSGSYSWEIDDGLDAATNYKIKITSNDERSVAVTSSYFAISALTPTITVKAPASGASWKADQSHTITWTYASLDSDSTVRIDLYKGSSKVATIDTDVDVGIGGSGSYKWTPDSDLTTAATYKIKISSEDVSCTGSSGYFTINN